MYTFNIFEANSLDELAEDAAYYMWQNDDYFSANEVIFTNKIGGIEIEKTLSNDELCDFQDKIEKLYNEFDRNYKEEVENQKLSEQDYYANLI